MDSLNIFKRLINGPCKLVFRSHVSCPSDKRLELEYTENKELFMLSSVGANIPYPGETQFRDTS